MMQWEYKVTRSNQDGLNQLGKDGWELVASCVENSPTFGREVVTHYLKRPLQKADQLLTEKKQD